jgi:hypothetical protein
MCVLALVYSVLLVLLPASVIPILERPVDTERTAAVPDPFCWFRFVAYIVLLMLNFDAYTQDWKREAPSSVNYKP